MMPTLNGAVERKAEYGVLWFESFPLTLYDDLEEAKTVAEWTGGTVVVKYIGEADWKVAA